MEFSISRYRTVTSTMDVAREQAERGAAEGTVVVADEQTAGRGRSTHTWYSPPEQSLYVSLLLRPTLAAGQIGWITMVAALAVREVLLEIRDWRLRPSVLGEIGPAALSNLQSPISNLQLPISIKWFNDVLLHGRKVCGILLEVSFTGDRLDYGILGIGLNVNTSFDDAPADVRARATSLYDEWARINEGNESAQPFDREELLKRLLARFGERYSALLKAPISPAHEYAQYVETLGRDVRIDTGREIIAGRALRIADDGALIVRTEAGERRVGFGDVM
ncbi:MAG: biotin--[acetyl-CoA-carboxylase] ligase [Chloroflexi bacterium]|nr:biotin--[acetyl-CoA-carboxylase] ligase [Chloroflexota bacterium]